MEEPEDTWHPEQNAIPGKLWNSRFTASCLGALLVGCTMFMTSAIMAPYVYSLYGNAVFTGVLNAAFAICAIIARFSSERTSDRKGHGWTMAAGSLVLAVSTFAFGALPVAAALVALRALQGLGFSFASTGASAAGTDAIPAGRESTGISFLSMGVAVATAVGPAIGLGLVSAAGFEVAFAVAGALSFGAAVLALIFLKKKRQNGTQEPSETTAVPHAADETRKGGFGRPIERSALPATACQFLNYLAQVAVNVYIVVFAESRGITGSALFFLVMAACMCVVRLFSGRLISFAGIRTTAVVASAFSLGAYLLLPNCTSDPLFFAAAALLGIGQGIFIPCTQMSAVLPAPSERIGVANSTYQLANDLSLGIGSLVWGLVVDSLGYNAMFAGCSVCVVLSAVLVVALKIGR